MLTFRDGRILKMAILCYLQSCIAIIIQEFQTESRYTPSTMTARCDNLFSVTEQLPIRHTLHRQIPYRHGPAWCMGRQNWTIEQCKIAQWSDESWYTVWPSDGIVWVWQMAGERHILACVVRTVKFGGDGVTVWSLFSWWTLDSLLLHVAMSRDKVTLTF